MADAPTADRDARHRRRDQETQCRARRREQDPRRDVRPGGGGLRTGSREEQDRARIGNARLGVQRMSRRRARDQLALDPGLPSRERICESVELGGPSRPRTAPGLGSDLARPGRERADLREELRPRDPGLALEGAFETCRIGGEGEQRDVALHGWQARAAR